MTMTLTEVIKNLTNGNAVTWQGSGSFKSGTIHLDQPGQRRLFDFLANADEGEVANAADSLFGGLTTAWLNEESDPANVEETAPVSYESGPWRLYHIHASGFGGLCTPNGPPFELSVNGENWCLEGYNGSGKTSLASLILWTLTGYRNREQDGPSKDSGQREAVTNGAKKIGTWPPLVTYPAEPANLKKMAYVSSTLTFVDPTGNKAQITRSVASPEDGDPVVSVTADDELILPPELIETGLLMPARIGHIGFGSKSQSLYDALKMLTGLDQLASIGLGAAGLCHGAKRFLKYAKNNGIDGYERAFLSCLEQAREHAKESQFEISETLELGSKTLEIDLAAIEADASTKAGAALGVLKTEISSTIDLGKSDDRDRLADAVNEARVYLGDGVKGIPLFDAWGALKQADEEGFFDIEKPLADAKESLAVALSWHKKQHSDEKLRLKALASQFYLSEDLLDDVANCPLCDTKLTSEEQKALAAELAALKHEAVFAERAIADACRDIIQTLKEFVSPGLSKHETMLENMDPAAAFASTIKARFSEAAPFSNVLTGVGNFVADYADKCAQNLPSFEHLDSTVVDSEIGDVARVQDYIRKVERLSALTVWWKNNRAVFVDAWKNIVGEKTAEGEWPQDSLEGKLQALKNAIASSGPLDKIAKQIKAAKEAARSWSTVQQVQETREAIAEAIEPLKALQHLVDSETHRTVVTLKGRVETILDDIRLKDRLSFVDTAMTKKAVTVEGQFSQGMRIDAALVANSSWLRALLWAFIFAMREQSITDANANVFPLMVLDDPQTTFDPKNKRKWASKIVEIANLDASDPNGMQLFLTTHEHEFASIVSITCELTGQEGKMAGPTVSSKVAHIVNGTFLDRQFLKASKDEDDQEGFIYIQQVRVYCEDLLKIMLRPESYEISGDSLGKLCELLVKLNKDRVAPFDRSTFMKLCNLLNEKSVAIMKVLNLPHHTFDGTVGYAQAVDVNKYWKDKLQRAFVHAFQRAADFDAYGGVSHLFPSDNNVIEFPHGHLDQIKKLKLVSTGIAAAAESDGLVGSGLILIEEWEEPEPIRLFDLDAYHLNSGTLDPVAGIGDVILVQNFGEPRRRNLTVTAVGERLYARRLNETADGGEVAVLTAQATDPYALHAPVIVPRSSIKPRKIVGTLFMSKSAPVILATEHEVCEIEDFSLIESRLNDVKLFKVKGRSMEPIALDGQFVMTIDQQADLTSLAALNGELVIAVDEESSVFFKRLRVHDDLLVLESANSSHSTSSEILSVNENSKFKKLISIRSVVGVLFDLPVKI